MQTMSETDRQEKLVLYGYFVQWATLVFPPALIASLVYLLVVRGRVTHSELRSHIDWQLMTCAIVAAMVPVTFLLLVVGLSGVGTDAPVSIFVTFLLVGASFLFLPWLLYRLLRGTMTFSKQRPMRRLFP